MAVWWHGLVLSHTTEGPAVAGCLVIIITSKKYQGFTITTVKVMSSPHLAAMMRDRGFTPQE